MRNLAKKSAFKSVSASDSTFTNHVVSSGTKAMPMPHLKQLLTSLQVRLSWEFVDIRISLFSNIGILQLFNKINGFWNEKVKHGSTET